MDWFRSWHGASTDNKWRVIAKKAGVPTGMVSAFVWALLDFASQHENRGSVDGFDLETYSEYSGFDVLKCHAMSRALCDKGIISDQKFKNWDKRQIKREDKTAAERQRNHRLKKSVTHVTLDVTQSNGREEERRAEERREEQILPTQLETVVKKTPLPPKRFSAARGQQEGFKKFGDLVGGQEGAFDIEKFLQPADWREMLAVLPLWDRNLLCRRYNAWVEKKGRPDSPRAAFLGWMKKQPQNP